MNEMYEIYKQQNDLYDQLINHEDHEKNLQKFLAENFDFANKTVCELGVGTGRVTRMYADKIRKASLFDISEHMISRAVENISAYSDKAEFKILDNKNTEQIHDNYDFLIEGWSFGHLISDEENSGFWIAKLISDCKKIAKTNIWIETMGTFVEYAKPPTEKLNRFYSELKKNGFSETIIRTDYEFDSVDQAKHILGSFFGKGMEEKIEKENKTIIKEYTGIWTFVS